MTNEMLVFLLLFFTSTVALMASLRFVKNEKTKDLVLKIFAWLCFGFHISIMWKTAIENGGVGQAPNSVLWPLYFCNVAMYLLLIVSYLDKKSKAFQWMATFLAYAGILGALITFVDYQFPFQNDAGVYSFERMKSTMSHAFLLVGSLYLFVGGYVKIRVRNAYVYMLGLLLNGFVGAMVNLLFVTQNIDPNINAMWIRQTAVAGVPELTGVGLGVATLAVMIVFSLLWELSAYQIAKRRKKPFISSLQLARENRKQLKSNLKNHKFVLTSAIIALFSIATIVLVAWQSVAYAM